MISPVVMAVDETARPRLVKEKSTMSAISRSSTHALDRQGTVASIGGIDLRSERSSVKNITVKPAATATDVGEEKTGFTIFGKTLPCLAWCSREDADTEELQPAPAPDVVPVKETKTKPEKKVGKKGEKVTGKAGKKGGKKEAGKKEDGKKKDGKKGGGKKEDGKKETGKKQDEEKEKKTTEQQTEPDTNGAAVTDGQLNRSPRATSTPIPLRTDRTPTSPGSARSTRNGVLAINSGAAAILKPEAKSNEWTFLTCCFGNRQPEPEAEEPKVAEEEPITKKAKGGAAAKGKGGSSVAKKGGAGKKDGTGAKKGTKTSGKKTASEDKSSDGKAVNAKAANGKVSNGKVANGKLANGNAEAMIVEDVEDGPAPLDRAKTMPERHRERTEMSLMDAERVKVDVYIPDDNTVLNLKDTVTVVNEKGGKKFKERAKTSLGVMESPERPASERPPATVKTPKGKGDKKGGKGKKDKGGKEKKATKKKKE
ncbi:ribosome-binding protein 1-like [Mya arenaria]|uniref:ribosome-binding protein 1-like n=1 Tax=Mya arenaria TaxID=6604 RepID=UPI0022E360C3|nr:ribosome-binding protein 1-like [Mya arenaria]